MFVWIDATGSAQPLRLFGMTLLERLLRALAQSSVRLREVRIEIGPDTPIPAALPEGAIADLPIRWSTEPAPLARRLARALRDAAGEPVLALAADCVVDSRLIENFAASSGGVAFFGGEGRERGALLRLEQELAEASDQDADLLAIAQRAVRYGAAKELAAGDFDDYVRKLRRTLPLYLFRVSDAASRDRAERFLFWSNYKGSTDFLTKYVYPPLVWRAVRPLARHRIHPNWVTALSCVATLVSLPCFALGAWGPGLALAYLMSVLDSVDGKLARLTFTTSGIGDRLDHGLDVIHPPAWYMAWGWALGGGDPASAPFRASLLLLAVYVLDRLCAPVFKSRTGRSIHGYTPLDGKLRTVISRRNVNLAVFTVALGIDAVTGGHRFAVAALYLIVAWQGLSFAWHVERIVQYWNARASR